MDRVSHHVAVRLLRLHGVVVESRVIGPHRGYRCSAIALGFGRQPASANEPCEVAEGGLPGEMW